MTLAALPDELLELIIVLAADYELNRTTYLLRRVSRRFEIIINSSFRLSLLRQLPIDTLIDGIQQHTKITKAHDLDHLLLQLCNSNPQGSADFIKQTHPSLIMFTVENNLLQITQRILDSGVVHVDRRDEWALPNYKDVGCISPAWIAIRQNNLEMMRTLFSNKQIKLPYNGFFTGHHSVKSAEAHEILLQACQSKGELDKDLHEIAEIGLSRPQLFSLEVAERHGYKFTPLTIEAYFITWPTDIDCEEFVECLDWFMTHVPLELLLYKLKCGEESPRRQACEDRILSYITKHPERLIE